MSHHPISDAATAGLHIDTNKHPVGIHVNTDSIATTCNCPYGTQDPRCCLNQWQRDGACGPELDPDCPCYADGQADADATYRRTSELSRQAVKELAEALHAWDAAPWGKDRPFPWKAVDAARNVVAVFAQMYGGTSEGS